MFIPQRTAIYDSEYGHVHIYIGHHIALFIYLAFNCGRRPSVLMVTTDGGSSQISSVFNRESPPVLFPGYIFYKLCNLHNRSFAKATSHASRNINQVQTGKLSKKNQIKNLLSSSSFLVFSYIC